MNFVYKDKSILGEAAGYSIGLIKTKHFDKDFVENLFNISRNNQHDRIS